MEEDLNGSLFATSGAIENGLSERMFLRRLSTTNPPHVCVVGAGVAGLRCADVLTRHGVKVTIFEARNRVGGRVSFCVYLQYSGKWYANAPVALPKRSWRSSRGLVGSAVQPNFLSVII